MVVREDRKEQIIDNAVGVISKHGYYKATTAMIAKASGVTQPYVFHFFASKEELFKAVVDRAVSRIHHAFAEAEAPADHLFETMGRAFISIMHANRDEIILFMQAYTINEPNIREHVRKKFILIHEVITAKFKKVNIPHAEASACQFMGTGFFITVSETLDLSHLNCYK